MMAICTIRIAIMLTNTRSRSAQKTQTNVRRTAAATNRVTSTAQAADTNQYRMGIMSITWSTVIFITRTATTAMTTVRWNSPERC
jgi:hypothetical protein